MLIKFLCCIFFFIFWWPNFKKHTYVAYAKSLNGFHNKTKFFTENWCVILYHNNRLHNNSNKKSMNFKLHGNFFFRIKEYKISKIKQQNSTNKNISKEEGKKMLPLRQPTKLELRFSTFSTSQRSTNIPLRMREWQSTVICQKTCSVRTIFSLHTATTTIIICAYFYITVSMQSTSWYLNLGIEQSKNKKIIMKWKTLDIFFFG